MKTFRIGRKVDHFHTPKASSPILIKRQDKKSKYVSITVDQKTVPTPVFLPGESQGWRSLMGFRLWGHTESDTTEVTLAAAAEDCRTSALALQKINLKSKEQQTMLKRVSEAKSWRTLPTMLILWTLEDIGAFTYNNELIRYEVSETLLCSGDDKLVSLRLKIGTPVSRLSQ